jgi:glycosyltransferase involved in cell wall biosynthesis
MPKVSIIIPVYNVEKYLTECLDSAMGQTLRDIEIICVDDGSTDRSTEILDEYAKKDSRITVIHQSNGGPSKARNTGIDTATGEYILFLDSDDIIKPTLCETTTNIADQEQADQTYFLFDTSLKPMRKKCDQFLMKGLRNELRDCDLSQNILVWSRLWRTKFIQQGKLRFPPDIIYGYEDAIFVWHAISLNPKNTFLPIRLLWYRVSKGSITKNFACYRHTVKIWERIKENLIHAGKYESEWKECFLIGKLHAMVACYDRSPNKLRSIILDEIREHIGDDECEYLMKRHNLPWYVTDFYDAINGSRFAQIKRSINTILRTARTIIDINRALLFQYLRKSS